MSKDIKFSHNFKNHYKKISKQPAFKKSKYLDVLTKLSNNKPLDRVYDDHAAKKSSPKHLQGRRILHLAPNICLIYRVTDDAVYFEDIGSHQDLELTETLENLVRANGSKYLNWLLKD